MVCWMSDTKPLVAQGRLIVKHSTRYGQGIVRDLPVPAGRHTLHRDEARPSSP